MDDLIKIDNMPAELEILGPFQGKVLQVNDSMPNIDFRGLLNKVFQYVNIAEVMDTIQKGAEYVVEFDESERAKVCVGELQIVIDFANKKCANNKTLKRNRYSACSY